MDFRYLNLCTIFSYKVTDKKNNLISIYTNDFKDDPTITPCFRRYFKQSGLDGVDYKTTFKIIIYFTNRTIVNCKNNNYCMLTLSEFDDYLEILKKIVPFEYNYEFINDGVMLLNVESNNSHFHNKWLLTSIRSCYEYPSSFAIKDVMLLKDSQIFKEMGIINGFNMVLGTLTTSSGDQTVVRYARSFPELLSDEALISKLQNGGVTRSSLNMVYFNTSKKNVGKYSGCLGRYVNSTTVETITNKFSKINVDSRLKVIYTPLYNKLKNG